MRKSRVAMVIAVVIMVLVPSSTASATARGKAEITSGGTMLPAPARSISLRITNNEEGVLGRLINRVSIVLPTGTAGIVHNTQPVTPPSGWLVDKHVMGPIHTFTFTHGVGLAPGANVTFVLPVEALRPLDRDRRGRLRASLSSDYGLTYAPAEDPWPPLVTVQALEVAAAPRITSPAGATDGTVTEDQTATVAWSVRNHALTALDVRTELRSNSSDTTPPATTRSLAPDETFSFSGPVTFAAAVVDRSSILTASADHATLANTFATSRTTQFQVQRRPSLGSFTISPDAAGTQSSTSFQITAAKSGSPALSVSKATLEFAGTTANLASPASFTPNGTLTFAPTTVAGADGSYPAKLTLSGTDGNGAAWSQAANAGTIAIDSTAPATKVTAGIPAGQDAVKNGDPVNLTVTVSDAGGRPATIRGLLRPSAGADIEVPLTLTSGNATNSVYQGSVSPSFHPDAISFVAIASAADRAANIGESESAPVVVDNVKPILFDPARVLSATSVRADFRDTRPTTLAGGCDPASYLINGQSGRVTEVRFANGTSSCLGKSAAGQGGYRVLVLGSPLPQSDNPSVTYSATSRDLLMDGARNAASTTTVGLRDQLSSPALLSASRNSGAETAYDDGTGGGMHRWHTRFAGGDLQLRLGGAQNRYIVQVLDAQENVLSERQLSGQGVFEATTPVPIGSAPGAYARSVRFKDTDGEIGPASPFEVVLDTQSPKIGSATGNDASLVSVEVSFDEPVVAGTDRAHDWFITESPLGPPSKDYFQAQAVYWGSATIRFVSYRSPSGGKDFSRADYVFRSSDQGGIRYADRAGNTMSDTL